MITWLQAFECAILAHIQTLRWSHVIMIFLKWLTKIATECICRHMTEEVVNQTWDPRICLVKVNQCDIELQYLQNCWTSLYRSRRKRIIVILLWKLNTWQVSQGLKCKPFILMHHQMKCIFWSLISYPRFKSTRPDAYSWTSKTSLLPNGLFRKVT